MTKADIIRQNERLRNRFIKQNRPHIKKSLEAQYSSYTSMLKQHGPDYVLRNLDTLRIDGNLAAAIQRLYVSAGVAKANMTYRILQRLPKTQRKGGGLGFNAQWTSDILNYFRLHLFNKVVLPIMETTQEYIRRILQQGINEGWGISEMVEAIERQDYLDGRVERILRTEITRAVGYGNELAGNSYQFKTQKQWIAVHDNRTRHWHLEADGQQVEMDGSFTVGGEQMDFPGDPNASARNVINCRCVTAIVPVRDETGRLVPKEPYSKPRISTALREQIQEIIAELGK